jgi:hypothetical protein
MLHEHAQFEDKSVSVELASWTCSRECRPADSRSSNTLNDWWEEFRLYHRKDGKVVKEGDDLMSATRYAIMMLHFASTLRQIPPAP